MSQYGWAISGTPADAIALGPAGPPPSQIVTTAKRTPTSIRGPLFCRVPVTISYVANAPREPSAASIRVFARLPGGLNPCVVDHEPVEEGIEVRAPDAVGRPVAGQ